MSKFFKYPFAQTGDTTNIPDDSAGNEVSYADGFTPAYELPYSQAGSKDIPRQVLNGILNDITSAIAEMQKQGIATWAEAGKPYPKGALAQKNGINYVSKVENNNQEPPGANWDTLGEGSSVPPGRTISTSAPLTGGGNLSANRTLSINAAGAATPTANGTPGSVVYAADNNTTARNMAATPAGVAAQIAALGGGGLKDVKTYASSGTYTVPAGVKKIMVIAVGAGGSGGQLNQNKEFNIGGGGGGWGLRLYNVTPGSTYPMVVGAGGQRTGSGNGIKGGDTTFGGTNGVGGSGGMGGISGDSAAGGNYMGGAIAGGNGGPGLRTEHGAIGGSCFFSGPTVGNEGGAGTGGGYSGSGTSKGGVGFIMVFEYQ